MDMTMPRGFAAERKAQLLAELATLVRICIQHAQPSELFAVLAQEFRNQTGSHDWDICIEAAEDAALNTAGLKFEGWEITPQDIEDERHCVLHGVMP